MRIVLDSNVLLIALGQTSRFKPIWHYFLEGIYELVISEDILHEYEEILERLGIKGLSADVLEVFSFSPDIIFQKIYYKWNLISSDPDDNKFFDAAVAGNADYLVTNDAHFNEIKNIGFPKINIISAEEFLKILEKGTR